MSFTQKLQIITGFTVEQLIEIFAAGYTLEKPDYSKSFEEIASLAKPPAERGADVRGMLLHQK